MWVRGLKHVFAVVHVLRAVAPYVGAWIETKVGNEGREIVASHPMWVRGLKHGSRRQNNLAT